MKKLLTVSSFCLALTSCAGYNVNFNDQPLNLNNNAVVKTEVVQKERLSPQFLVGVDNGQSVSLSLEEGFGNALINSQPAHVNRVNDNFYEVSNNKYMISVSLNDEGFQSASWNHLKGKENGVMHVVAK